MPERAKILVVLSRVPFPLDKGDKLRAFNQIKGLAVRNEIYLFALNDTKLDEQALKELTPFCREICIVPIHKLEIIWSLCLGMLGSKPFQVYYFYHRKAQKKFDAFYHKVKPNAIYCQLIRTAEYAKNITEIPKTLDYQDALAKGMSRRITNAPFYLKAFYRMENERLTNYEHIIFHYFENHTIISNQDRNFILHEENQRISVIPNGVDFTYYTPQENVEKDFDLVFTGNMSYPPNINCAHYIVTEVMPLVWQQLPQTRLLISGTSPDREVLALESEKICVGGRVNDIRESYERSRIFIAPMRIGSGLQNKILEAMSMGMPCITSSLANNPLGAQEQKEILVGNSKEEVAQYIIDLLKNPSKANEIAQNGRDFVIKNYSWEQHNKALEEIILSRHEID